MTSQSKAKTPVGEEKRCPNPHCVGGNIYTRPLKAGPTAPLRFVGPCRHPFHEPDPPSPEPSEPSTERCAGTGEIPTTLYGDEYPAEGFWTTTTCPGCPDCSPDPSSNEGERYLIYVCKEHGIRTPERDGGWLYCSECDLQLDPDGERVREVEVVSASSLTETQALLGRYREGLEEAVRCLTLIGHVPRSENTWASRCRAATTVLMSLRTDDSAPDSRSDAPRSNPEGQGSDARTQAPADPPTPPESQPQPASRSASTDSSPSSPPSLEGLTRDTSGGD